MTPVLVVEEAEVPGENHRPWASNWYILSLAAASRVHPFCNLQSRARTHARLVIGLYELLCNPTIYLTELPGPCNLLKMCQYLLRFYNYTLLTITVLLTYEFTSSKLSAIEPSAYFIATVNLSLVIYTQAAETLKSELQYNIYKQAAEALKSELQYNIYTQAAEALKLELQYNIYTGC